LYNQTIIDMHFHNVSHTINPQYCQLLCHIHEAESTVESSQSKHPLTSQILLIHVKR